MQSQDHLRRALRSELQLDKRKVRSYKSEYWADGIRIRGRSNEIGLSIDIRDISTRKGIRGIDVYEKTELSDQADETYVVAQISTCQTTRRLPKVTCRRLHLPEAEPRTSMLEVFSCRSVPLSSGDAARGIRCSG